MSLISEYLKSQQQKSASASKWSVASAQNPLDILSEEAIENYLKNTAGTFDAKILAEKIKLEKTFFIQSENGLFVFTPVN